MVKQYGISSIESSEAALDRHLENIRLRGYTILTDVIPSEVIEKFKKSLEEVYVNQEREFGKIELGEISELDIVRAPFAYDESFLSLITEPKIHQIIRAILGENYVLQLQNSIINRANVEHHQASWHRDIPYQEYTLSRPISMNAFYCLSPFTKETGGTIFLPYSHKFEKFPSLGFLEENQIQPELNSGDVIIFDSWLYHKAGNNSSKLDRYGINHVFTSPILAQQINLPRLLKGKYSENEQLYELLGYKYERPDSVLEYRKERLQRVKQRNEK